MPSVVKTFDFASTADGWTLTAGSWDSVAHTAGDGNPSGSIAFNDTGRNDTASTGITWTGTFEDLGVPSGTTVTGYSAAAFDHKVAVWNVVDSASSGPLEINDGTARTLVTSVAHTGTTAWVTRSASPAISGLSLPSNTAVTLTFTAAGDNGNNASAQVELRVDNISLTIDYSAGSTQTGAMTSAATGGETLAGVKIATGAMTKAATGAETLAGKRYWDSTGKWTPSELGSAVKVWFDAYDPDSITLVSGDVSAIASQVQSFSASQPTSGLRPTYTDNGINGRPSIVFDDTASEFLEFNPSGLGLPTAGNEGHTFAVASYTNSGNTGYPSVLSVGDRTTNAAPPTGTRYSVREISVNTSENAHYDVWYDGVDSGSSWLNTPRIVQGRHIGETIGVRVDGGTEATKTAGYVDQSNPLYGSLGSGCGPTEEGFWDGPFGEGLIYVGSLSTSDREKIEGYLAHKWGLAANLPSGHPYETDPPTVSSVQTGALSNAATSAETLNAVEIATGAITDAATAAETLAGSRIQSGALTDASTGAETLAGAAVQSGAITDASTGAETIAGTRLAQGAVTDAATGAESLAGARLQSGAVTDAATSGETLNAAEIASGALSDAATAGETLAANAIRSGALVDAASSGQTFAPGAELGAVTDVATSGETLAGSAVRSGALVDAGTAAETLAGAAVMSGALVDAATAAEALAANAVRSGALTDAATSDQVFTPGTDAVTGAMTDAATAAATFAGVAVRKAALAKAAAAGEAISSIVVAAGALSASATSSQAFTAEGAAPAPVTRDGDGADTPAGGRRRFLGRRAWKWQTVEEAVDDLEEIIATGDAEEAQEALEAFAEAQPLFGFEMPAGALPVAAVAVTTLDPVDDLREVIAAYRRWVDEDDAEIEMLMLA